MNRVVEHVEAKKSYHCQAACHFAQRTCDQSEGGPGSRFSGLFPIPSTQHLKSESSDKWTDQQARKCKEESHNSPEHRTKCSPPRRSEFLRAINTGHVIHDH